MLLAGGSGLPTRRLALVREWWEAEAELLPNVISRHQTLTGATGAPCGRNAVAKEAIHVVIQTAHRIQEKPSLPKQALVFSSCLGVGVGGRASRDADERAGPAS